MGIFPISNLCKISSTVSLLSKPTVRLSQWRRDGHDELPIQNNALLKGNPSNSPWICMVWSPPTFYDILILMTPFLHIPNKLKGFFLVGAEPPCSKTSLQEIKHRLGTGFISEMGLAVAIFPASTATWNAKNRTQKLWRQQGNNSKGSARMSPEPIVINGILHG